MGFFKTLFTGYKIMYNDITVKHPDLLPRCFSGCGTGLMMIGSAVMAKTGMQDDVKQVLDDCDKAIEEARKAGGKKKYFLAKAKKGLKIVKVFRKGIAYEVGGAVLNGVGLGISENGKHKAIKAAGAIGAAFAGYRANVREDLGEEADLRYLTGRKAVKRTEKVDKKTGEITEVLERADGNEIVIKKDPSAFRFWFSKETCPSLWSDNLDLRKSNLKWVTDNLTHRFQTVGYLPLNDQRREFGGLEPATMDVDIGGIFGKVADPNKPRMQQFINLHWQDDEDFMQGLTEGCWIIFDCDPEPIIGRICKKMTQVEV